MSDDTVADVVDELKDTLALINPDDTLTGFAIVMEWVTDDGSRALGIVKPPSTPPWELQGWLYHLLQDPEGFDATADLAELLESLGEEEDEEE